MIIDSSALVAIIRNEQDAGIYREAILAAPRVVIASPTYLECCSVLTKDRTQDVVQEVDILLRKLSVDIIAFTPRMAEVAARAFLLYGKGRGNAAQLNFGDCISYAVSKTELMPLLFKGNDFTHTDVERAI